MFHDHGVRIEGQNTSSISTNLYLELLKLPMFLGESHKISTISRRELNRNNSRI